MTNIPFLKMFLSQNPMHESDRENANSLNLNIVVLPKSKLKGKFLHFFNKKAIKEMKHTHFDDETLYQLG